MRSGEPRCAWRCATEVQSSERLLLRFGVLVTTDVVTLRDLATVATHMCIAACPEPYTREEILEERFGQLLRGLSFPKEILEWIVSALRESHVDEKAFHDEAIARLQAEYRRLQSRIDAMYMDKLDGRIDAAFFDGKSAEWRAEQDRLLRDVETHQGANQTYIEEGVQLLHLAQRAHELFERQEAAEKRRLLNFLLSNCTWKGGVLTAEYRQPFDMLALAREAGSGDEVMSGAKNGQFENWLPKSNKECFTVERHRQND